MHALKKSNKNIYSHVCYTFKKFNGSSKMKMQHS